MRKKKNLLLVHGAWASHHSFAYFTVMLQKHLKDHIRNITYFEYNPIKEGMENIVSRAYKELDKDSHETIVVGHSMGGLISLFVSDHPNSCHTVTIASPLSGVKIDRLFQPFVYSRSHILAEIAPNSAFISALHRKKFKKPVDCIITTEGFNPALLEKNDGVVSIHSQERWLPENAVATYIANNHHEIMQSERAFDVLRKVLTSPTR